MWVKSSYCNGADACVELLPTCGHNGNCLVASLCDCGEVRKVLVRDSKLGAASPVLAFTVEEWEEFQRHMQAVYEGAEAMGDYPGQVILTQVRDNVWEMTRRDQPQVTLTFDDAEMEAFTQGLLGGEFTPEALSRPPVDAVPVS
ncbi:DUF397 domain-containing protein [Nonomuraea polychroma]|uniref:DUF397 domain-containing protein n=1 Tax=Nonomuraea polychroma TaxID=46176 RepID=UPI003D914B9C